MPGAPLLRTTAARAASMLSGAQIASMRWLVDAGLSGSGVAVTASTSCPSERGASPRPGSGKSNSSWDGDRDAVMRRPSELPFPSPPFAGTVRAFGRRAGLLCPLLTSAPRSGGLSAPSVPGDTVQISWGKPRSLPRTPAGFTVLALDGYGLCDFLPARPTSAASYPVSVRRVAILLHASFRRSLAVPPLRFARASPPSGCTGDFHPQAAGHAQHTGRLRSHRPPVHRRYSLRTHAGSAAARIEPPRSPARPHRSAAAPSHW